MLRGASSRGKCGPPFGTSALGGWLIPDCVVQSLDGLVQRRTDGLGISTQEIPHRGRRDIEPRGQADP